MVAAPLAQQIDIRTFGSIREVWALGNFIENNPLSETSYKRLLGEYHLPEEVRCCFLKKNGNLCGEKHKHGWVVERQDGTVTIIGGDCAKYNFGADSSLVVDSRRYHNEKQRRERLAIMSQLLAQKAERIAQLSTLRTSLQDLDKRIKRLTGELGPIVQRRLRDMVRTARSEVSIDATKRREYVDTDGKTKYETSTFVHVLGSLDGLALTVPGSYIDIYDGINEIVRAYQRAEELEQDLDVVRKSKGVEKVVALLQQCDRILHNGQRLINLELIFHANNFLLLCFLSSDKVERVKAAKLAIRRIVKDHYKSDPLEWLSAQENALKRQLQVDVITVR